MPKLHWDNLTKPERALYMRYQMSGSGNRSSMIPDDCYMCPVCDTPSLSSGLCSLCYHDFDKLDKKLRKEKNG